MPAMVAQDNTDRTLGVCDTADAMIRGGWMGEIALPDDGCARGFAEDVAVRIPGAKIHATDRAYYVYCDRSILTVERRERAGPIRWKPEEAAQMSVGAIAETVKPLLASQRFGKTVAIHMFCDAMEMATGTRPIVISSGPSDAPRKAPRCDVIIPEEFASLPKIEEVD